MIGRRRGDLARTGPAKVRFTDSVGPFPTPRLHVEFLSYDKILASLARLGVVEVADGELLHFTLDGSEAVRVAIAPKGSPVGAGVEHVFGCPLDRIGEKAEQVLHRLHIGDVAIVPAPRWRDVLDLVVFDLAKDEVWLEVDTDATLHQNVRDPLVVPPKHRHIIRTLVSSLMANGESPSHDVTIAGLESPFLMSVAPGRSLTITCPSEGVAQTLLGKLA